MEEFLLNHSANKRLPFEFGFPILSKLANLVDCLVNRAFTLRMTANEQKTPPKSEAELLQLPNTDLSGPTLTGQLKVFNQAQSQPNTNDLVDRVQELMSKTRKNSARTRPSSTPSEKSDPTELNPRAVLRQLQDSGVLTPQTIEAAIA